MASDLSTYLGNKIVRWLGGSAMPTAPTDIYIALFNGDPKATGGVEVTDTIRVAGRVAGSFTVPTSGEINLLETDTDTDFGDAAGAADVSHVAVFDAATSGNLLASKALAAPVSISAGQPVKFLAGDLDFTIGS